MYGISFLVTFMSFTSIVLNYFLRHISLLSYFSIYNPFYFLMCSARVSSNLKGVTIFFVYLSLLYPYLVTLSSQGTKLTRYINILYAS